MTHKDTTMLGRCARAACHAAGINPSPEQIKVASVFTRAILNELKHPSEGMREAMKRHYLNGSHNPYADISVSLGSSFTAAIDFVLNEGEGK